MTENKPVYLICVRMKQLALNHQTKKKTNCPVWALMFYSQFQIHRLLAMFLCWFNVCKTCTI